MSYRLKTTALCLAITFTACTTDNGTEPQGTQNPPGPTAPAAPTSLVATALASSQIRLTWIDAASNEDRFTLERCSGAGCTNFTFLSNPPANSTAFLDIGVVAATSYSYRVLAFNSVGPSSYSNAATAVTLAAGAIPAPPTSPTATVLNSSRIDITWTDASDNEDGFRVERCQGAGCTNFATVVTTLSPNGTLYSNWNLNASTTYRYRVQSYNGSGGSAFAGPVEATTAAAILPNGTPSGLVATAVSSTRINLTWNDNATNEDAYHLERCSGAGCTNFLVIAYTPGATFSDQNLSANTSYSYRVKAVNGAGSSPYSATASATTALTSPPAAPSGLSVQAVSTSAISISWTDNSSNEDGFRIERCEGVGCTNFAQVLTAGANATTVQNTGLAPGTVYMYRVRAFNGAGNSGYSTTASAATPPAAPSNLVAVPHAPSRIDLTWTDNSNNEVGFVVERCQGAGCSTFAMITTTGPNTTFYSSAGLTAATSYSYRVRSVHSVAGSSSYSGTATAVTPALTAPLLATPTVSGSTVTLSWTYTWPALASSADRYELEESTTSPTAGFAAVHSPQSRTTPYMHTLTRGAGTYHYRVRALTSEGTTPYSTVRSVTVTAAQPVISVSVSSRTFTATAGGTNPVAQQAQVGNAGGGSLTGLAVSENPSAAWLAVTLSSTTAPATLTFQVTTGTLAAGTYTTAVHVTSPVASNSPQTVQVTFTVAAPPAGPSTLRIINDLPGNIVGPNDWGRLNTVVRLRVGPTQSSVTNMTAGAVELLFNGMSTSNVTETLDINPGQTLTFDVSMMTGTYYLYIQNGWWDYFAPTNAWEKHLTGVVGCDGVSTVYKGTIIQITQPFGNPEEIRLSDWLPIGNYYGSPFCN